MRHSWSMVLGRTELPVLGRIELLVQRMRLELVLELDIDIHQRFGRMMRVHLNAVVAAGDDDDGAVVEEPAAVELDNYIQAPEFQDVH